jgi:SAM-dependent methyltransferase
VSTAAATRPAVPTADLFARALAGEGCRVVGPDRRAVPLPVASWLAHPDQDDLAMVGHCAGPTLDIGCGPGRMTAALARAGRAVLGIDVVPEAVRLALQRGGTALRRDVNEPLPGEGRWPNALLADGNIGIGGDPVQLLRRVRALLAPGGRVVVEVAGPGVPLVTSLLHLDCGGIRSEPFPWSVVGVDEVCWIAGAAGLRVRSVHPHGRRWCAVLESS